MAQRQYQAQDDLDIGSLDVQDYSAHRKSRNSFDENVSRSGVRKPRLKSNFFNQIKVHQSSMKLAKSPKKASKKATVESAVKIENSTSSAPENATKAAAGSGCANDEDNDWLNNESWLKDLTADSFSELEDVKNSFTSKIEGLVNHDSLNAVLEGYVIACDVGFNFVRELLKHEEEFRYVSAMALISYGGTWNTLAGVIAAVEAFDTKRVLAEGYRVGMQFFSEDEDTEEDELKPSEITASIKQLGLQISLLISIMVSPSWAELCITIAFASKFTRLIPVQDILKRTISKPGPFPDDEDDIFDMVDDSWFDLLSVIACNIVSLTFFGCFPNLVTAAYMGYIGVSLLMEGLVNKVDLFQIDESFWLKNKTQYYAWSVVVIMSVWQAIYGYTGIAEPLSWLMFVYPVVRVFNFLTEESDSEETENMKAE